MSSRAPPHECWTSEQWMPTTPSMSPSTRVDVFHSVTDPYETFGTKTVTQKDFMTCGICKGLLYDPVVCPSNCTFVGCLSCLQRCQSCPQCRAPLPLRPVVTRHLQAILDSELKAQNVKFKCNTTPPGHSPPCLWCCEREFDTLKGLEEHLAQQCSFQCSRGAALDLWRRALHHEPARRELFGETGAQSRLHLATVMDEMDQWQAAEKLQREEARPRKRSRSHTTIDTPEDLMPRAVADTIAMSEALERLRRQMGDVQRIVFLR